jgi:Mlc titration factor MtfA (ptsG expression regulator)
MSQESKEILIAKVPFYTQLSNRDKIEFEFRIKEFLLNIDITGVGTRIDESDRLLLASSAIIPIFYFKEWRYLNIDEILLYPNAFDRSFSTKGKGRSILGMVGSGPMEGKMILSKRALHQGFSNETDKKNTAIHEFIHLIDKSDGLTDGVPSILLEKQYTIPWLDLMNRKMDQIRKKKTDINSYGAVNQIEFFAVASEYFFERPELLAKKHPELYGLLSKIFTRK